MLLHGWPEWLSQWGDRRQVALPAATAEFDRLAATAKPGWRLEQWRAKLRLETLDRQLSASTDWTASRHKLAEQFFIECEHLQRDVYRLGPLRHIFSKPFAAPAWAADFKPADLPAEA